MQNHSTPAPAFVPALSRSLPAHKPTSASTSSLLPPLSAAVTLPCPAARALTAPARPGAALSTEAHAQAIGADFSRSPGAGAATNAAVVLFRSDLRLDDHAALTAAVEAAGAAGVVPLFCFDPRRFGRTEHGFDRTGKYRARFLLDAVEDLRARLRALGADLVVRVGRPETVVPDVARAAGARHVFLHREATFEEQQVEAALAKALSAAHVDLTLLWSNTLYHEDDLPFPLHRMPDVYSDFREALEAKARIRDPLPAPKHLPAVSPAVDPGNVPTLADLGVSDLSPPSPAKHVGVNSWRGGEREALARLRTYIRDARIYSDEDSRTAAPAAFNAAAPLGRHRKFNSCAHLGADFSCKISPWLAIGCLSPCRIFYEMAKSLSAEALLRSSTYLELVWRDFFRCITTKYSSKRSAAAARTPARAAAAPQRAMAPAL